MVDHLAPVNNKVKGLLKGLRYISQIFDGEKEQDMVIGNPTDVKHVAHIGYEGPSVSSPRWVNEFSTPPLGQEGKEFGSTENGTEEVPNGVAFSPSREAVSPPKPYRTRHNTSTEGSTTDAPPPERHGSHHRRKSRSSGLGSDLLPQEGHKSRHHKHHSKHNNETTNQEKKTRKKERRRKGSMDGSSLSVEEKVEQVVTSEG